MAFIISIIFYVVTAYIVYMCFERYDFKTGAFAQIGILFLQKLVESSGNINFFSLLILSIIVGIICAGINYLIYTHSNSFIAFLIISIVVEFIIAGILTIIAAGMFVSLMANM